MEGAKFERQRTIILLESRNHILHDFTMTSFCPEKGKRSIFRKFLYSIPRFR